MVTEQISMVFFRNAGMICLAAAAAAFIIAGYMFFAFDIPEIFRIRTGLPAGRDLRIIACSTGKNSPLQEVPFRIVRTIMITDCDENIRLEDIFAGEDL